MSLKKNICINYFGQIRNIDVLKKTYSEFIYNHNYNYHILLTTWEDEKMIDKFKQIFPNSYVRKVILPDINIFQDIIKKYTIDPTNSHKSIEHYLLGLYIKNETKNTILEYLDQININFDIVVTLRTYIYIFDNNISQFFEHINNEENKIYIACDPKFNIYNQNAKPDVIFLSNQDVTLKAVNHFDCLEKTVVNNTNYFHPETSFGKNIIEKKIDIVELPFRAFPQII